MASSVSVLVATFLVLQLLTSTPASGQISKIGEEDSGGSYFALFGCNNADSYYCSFFVNGERYSESTHCRTYFPHRIAGTYTCSVTSQSGTRPGSTAAELNIYDRPVVRPVTTDPPVVGEDYALQCLTGASEKYIVWYIGNTLYPRNSGSSLFVRSPLYTFDRSFRCAIKVGDFQLDSSNLYIKVFAPTYASISVADQWNGELSTYYNLPPTSVKTRFSCSGGPNGEIFHLYQDGERIATKSSGSNFFRVFNSHRKTEFYSCSVSNINGQAVSDQVLVQETDAVKIIASTSIAILGHPLTLTCETERLGTNITYTWGMYKQEERNYGGSDIAPLQVENQNLTFDSVGVDDVGMYYCEAEVDGVSVKSYDHFVIVFLPPSAPNIARIFENGAKGNILCSTEGLFINVRNPFRLYRNGTEVTDVPYIDTGIFIGSFLLEPYYQVNLEDPANAGEYSCTVINTFGESNESSVVDISAEEITEKPVLTADKMDAALGEDVTFTCHVSDTVPDHEIHWIKDTEVLSPTGRTLTLSNLAIEDHGWYLCILIDRSSYYYDFYFEQSYIDEYGFDEYGKNSDPVFLTLRKPLQPLLAFHPDVMEVNEHAQYVYHYPVLYMFAVGETVRFKCVSEFPWSYLIRPRPRLQALEDGVVSHILCKDGVEIETSTGLGEFEISGLAAGVYNYTCMARNRVGDSPMSYPLTVNVAEGPTISVSPYSPSLGSNISMTCVTVETSDPRDIIWKKNGKLIFEGLGKITLDNANLHDEGVYTCRQKVNSWYYPNSQEYLLTFGRAATPEIFIFHSTPVKAGDTLKLYCLTASSTSHQATFFFNGNPIMTVDNADFDDAGQVCFVYYIRMVTTSNSGEYTCKVENRVAVSDVSNILTVAIGVCDAGRYGIDCAATCDCVTDHTSPEVCNSTAGTCLCLDGWTGDDCSQDINECTTSASACSDPNSYCINTAGSFLCQCNDGYLKKDGLCQECEANFYGSDCATACVCNPAIYECDKETGACNCYQGWRGYTCDIDVDECMQNTHDCGNYTPSATCVNTPGAYRCECPEGYKETSPQMCKDIDECSSNPCPSGQFCGNNDGSYTCQCPAGYTKSNDDTICVDIDECENSPCPIGQSCSNTDTSYECQCPAGYIKSNDGTCVDINECENSPCLSGQTCINTEGSHTCVETQSIRFMIGFPRFQPTDAMLNNGTEENAALVREITDNISAQLEDLIQGFLKFVVRRFRRGSLIVDGEVITDRESDPNADGLAAKMLQKLNVTDVPVNGTKYMDAQLLMGEDDTTDKTEMYIGIGVGVGVLVLVAIVAVISAVCVKMHNTHNKTKKHSEEWEHRDVHSDLKEAYYADRHY